jgi:hypothetical protein
MSNFRYAVANIEKLHRREASTKTDSLPLVQPIERQAGPVVSIRKESEGPIGFSAPGDEFARWRAGLGQPIRAGAFP